MTKKSKKRHIGSLGGGENVEHKSDRPAKKRKFNLPGTHTGAIRTPRSGMAAPSKTSCGKAVSSVMPSSQQTPNAVPTSSSGKGGEQQKQQDQQLSAVPTGARKESYDVYPSDGNRASSVAENVHFNPDRPYKVAKKKSNKRARRSRLRDPEISLLDNESTVSAHPQDDAHSKAAKKVEKADDAPPFGTTAPSANQTPAKMLPRHPTSKIAPAITTVLTETTQDHELHPPAGRGRRQRKKLKHRNRLTLAASSPMLSRTVSRQSAIATPTGQRSAPSARNSIDPELGVKLPEPPHGLNEHQRKLWTDRVRRVTLEILTPGKAAQSKTVEASAVSSPGRYRKQRLRRLSHRSENLIYSPPKSRIQNCGGRRPPPRWSQLRRSSGFARTRSFLPHQSTE
ncbi:hypothetical protein Tdes44962_MAKER01491 [Teratosphaeria destructans]|uniref:Uncharacterized protein n=1 Tax=Teratosphaeria destructans TaxID=418781 RepID=A0A9W7W5X2_9PEZI|nr:hypothetical protein Tdes44962_MAKER01491 [Teratosphaeria destructans]